METDRGGGADYGPDVARLLEREALWRALDDAPSLVYVKDLDNRFTYANGALCLALGLPRDQVMGRTTHDVLPAVVADQHVANDERVLREQAVVQVEETNAEPDGEHVYHTLKYPVRAPDGSVVGVCGISTDITEQSRREQAALAGQHTVRALLDAVVESALLLDVSGRILAVNDTAAKRLHIDPDEATGWGVWDVLPREVAEGRMAAITRVIEAREPLRFEDVRSGRTILNSITPVFDEDGNVVQVAAFGVDMTEAKRAAESLRESEERFRTLFETMAQGVIYQDADGHVVDVNPAALRILSATEDQLLGHATGGADWRTLREDGSAFPAEELPATRALRTGDEVRDVVLGVGRAHAESVRWISVNAVPQFRPGEDRPFRVFTTFDDVTAYRDALAALGASEAQYRLLAETVTDVVVRGTLQGELEWVSPSVTALLGWQPEEIRGSSMFGLVHPEDRASMERALDSLPRCGALHQEIRLRTAGGDWRWVSDTARCIVDDSGSPTGVVAGWRDIDAEVTARAALAESERTFRTVADFAYDWEFWRDSSGRLVWVSPSCERVTGFAAEDFLADDGLLLRIIHEDEPEQLRDHFVAWAPPTDGSTEHALEFRIRTKDGRIRWIGHRCHRVVLADGTDLGVRASNRDITDRKHAEREILQLATELEERVRRRTAELELANAELEAFTYSVSHDLRAPLRAIDGFTAMVEQDAAERLTGEDRTHLDRVRAAAQRMGALIDELLGLSRVSRWRLHVDDVDLSEMAEEILGELAEAEPERRVDCEVAPGLVIGADRELARIMLTNLLSNAWKFTGKHVEARIEVGTAVMEGERVFFVRDDGAGFDPQYAGRLFEAFQRLHPCDEFEGHGIGLATVDRIVRRHGGRIWAEAAVEGGATFYFTFPSGAGSRSSS